MSTRPATPQDAALQIGRMTAEEAAGTSALVQEIVSSLPYYNDRAKAAEIQKYTSAGLLMSIHEDPDSVLVANLAGQIVGFCISRYDDGVLWLAWIATHPHWRRQGVAAKLLAALEHTASRRSCHKVWCDCRTSNEASKALLSQVGYTPIATVRKHWYGQDFILWEKLVS
jgi:RimJ/RimL family protein N-acetyltransferase